MKVSGIFFALVIVAFLLPFMVVTCNGQKLGSASGIQLAIGAKASSGMGDVGNKMTESLGDFGNMFGMEEQTPKPTAGENKLKPNIPALVALIMAIAGLITALVLDPRKFFVPLGAAIIGIVCMILISITVKSEISGMGMEQQSMVTLAVKLQFGYYLAFLGFILAGILSVAGIKNRGVETAIPAGYAPYQKPVVTPPSAGVDNDQSFFDRARDFVEDKIEDAGDLVEKVKDKIDLDDVKEKIDDHVDLDKVEAGLGKVIGKETAETVIDKVEEHLKSDDKDIDKPS